MAFVFSKRAGAPAGTIKFDISGFTYLIDDVSNTTITVTDPSEASNLAAHPFLTQTSGTYTPPPTIQQILLVNGVLSIIDITGQYVDISPVIPADRGVQLATTAALPTHTGTTTRVASANGALTVDGTGAVVGNRVLVKDEVTASRNGIFKVTVAGDASTPWQMVQTNDQLFCGLGVSVGQGISNKGALLVLTTPDPIVAGTTSQSWTGPPAALGALLTAQNAYSRRQRIAISPNTRTNLVTRPRPGLAPNLTNWGADHATLTQAADVGVGDPFGGTSAVGKVVLTGTGVADFRPATTAPVPDTIAVVPGDILTCSFYAYQKATNTAAFQGNITIVWLNASNTTTGSSTSTSVTYGTGVWQLITHVSGAAPANTTHAQVFFQPSRQVSAIGDTYYFDGLLVEKNVSALGPYFDGNSPAGSWSGTALASTSINAGEDAYLQFRDLNNTITLGQIDANVKGWFNGVDGQGQRATTFADPTAAQDLVTRNYADTHYGGGANTLAHSMPNKLYAVTGKECNVYWENFLRPSAGIPLTDYQYNVVCAQGEQDEHRWFYTPIDADASTGISWSLEVSYNGVIVLTVNTTLVITPSTAGGSVNRKVVSIGDSLTAVPLSSTGIGWLAEEQRILASDTSYAMTQVGTFSGGETDSGGTVRTVKCDAVSGKTIPWMYSDPASPFVFSGVFNFAQYLTSNSITLASGDWVRIHLGANDVFGTTDDASTNTNITNSLSNLASMITNIKSAVSGIRIAILMTIPPTHSQDGFGASYGSGQTLGRYQRNRALWLEALRPVYDAAAVANVWLVPWHTQLDTRNGFPTSTVALSARNSVTYAKVVNSLHPVGSNGGIASTGFWQIADGAYAFFKNLA